ncbi:hypothetical protein AVEN_89110-1 [Araneus ventricosus]|uniref:Uncharacterized protein n=1 Tax=Araneus ventricosus TaxID=182803 RepID=A0A4Y2B1V0_ARAVE|nr:hypothetical protein AVEN_89110-1 [Araneus ventricosus]
MNTFFKAFHQDKAGHSHLFQNGIFGTRQGRKPIKFGRNDFECGIPTNSKSTSCADSNLRPRYDASGTSKVLPRLGPRDEDRKSEIRRVGGRNRGHRIATVGHFGAYLNDVNNFSIKMVGKRNGLRTNG